jgi:hypothetical protein
MNFLRKFMGSSPKEELATIPAGQLYLKRAPNSVKGTYECIFKDAVAAIRRTTTPYHYQLVIERVYEEGEAELADSEENASSIDDHEDEWAFLVDEALHISYGEKDDRVVIDWRDTQGEPGDKFEFVCSDDTKPKALDVFDFTAKKCQYERKYQREYGGENLDDFDFDDEEEQNQSRDSTVKKPIIAEAVEPAPAAPSTPVKARVPTPPSQTPAKQTEATLPEATAVNGDVVFESSVSWHLFDASAGVFIEQESAATVKLYDLGNWEYWMEVANETGPLLGLAMNSDMNPVFNYEHLSFIFNYFGAGGAFSFLLKFGSFELLEEFQGQFVTLLWQTQEKRAWVSIPETERDYIVDAFGELRLVGEEGGDEERQSDEGEFEDEGEEEPQGKLHSSRKDGEYDADEEFDADQKFVGQGKNSLLAVGTSSDRSFVVRGNRIGVFKQTAHNDLEFSTTIDRVATTSGREFSPEKIMLHQQDSALVMQDPNSADHLYRMDLEYGKVVDEWRIGDGVNLTSFAPTTKFAQTTGEQTLVGATKGALFKIDPRLSGDKLVYDQMKVTTASNEFSALTTTSKGYLAVASAKGDVRLYDRLGINAKTHIPALGDKIIGIDVSADGAWILATCKTYLLLIDATIKEGRNAGNIGFLKSFGKDSKPRPKRLQISPEHVAFMQSETRKPLSFTQAHFNTGLDAREQSIVTSSGPYVITWSLKKLIRGDKEPYLIKRYASEVTADNFKFGTDKNVIIALEDDVGMVSRSTFRKPTRESLATPARRLQALSRNSIVNSPF